jgi:ligand-binding SRPBCC domain-containing protein
MGDYHQTTTIEAPRAAVWDLIALQSNWSLWTPARQVVVDPPGSSEPNGVGAVRHMRALGPLGAREEITAFEPPELFAYRLLRGLPVRNYEASMRLVESGDATVLDWSGTWDDLAGFMQRPMAGFMQRTVTKMAGGIKAEAERRAAGDD